MQVLQDVILHVYSLQAPAAASTGESQQQQPPPPNNQNGNTSSAMSFFSRLLPSVGMGAYHTSIEVMDDRYTFAANAGIVKTRSRNEGIPTGATYKEAIPLGACSVKHRGEVQEIVNKLAQKFGPNSYHLVHRNCNHFTETLATALILKDQLIESSNQKTTKRLKSYPEWINRLANTGRMIISHDSDIVTCNVLEEASKAVGAGEKVGWDFTSTGSKGQTDTIKENKTKNGGKKELTEAQKAALAKIRGNKN